MPKSGWCSRTSATRRSPARTTEKATGRTAPRSASGPRTDHASPAGSIAVAAKSDLGVGARVEHLVRDRLLDRLTVAGAERVGQRAAVAQRGVHPERRGVEAGLERRALGIAFDHEARHAEDEVVAHRREEPLALGEDEALGGGVVDPGACHGGDRR